MSVVVAGHRSETSICAPSDENYSLLRTNTSGYGTNTSTVKSSISKLDNDVVNEPFTNRQSANLPSDTSSTSPTSPSTARHSECEGEHCSPLNTVTVTHRQDGGRYSITITGERTKNTAECVIGVEKPYFTLTSTSNLDSERYDDDEWEEAMANMGLHSSYDAAHSSYFTGLPNSGSQEQADWRSYAVNPMSIILFLTNLYWRFRRLFEVRGGSNQSSPRKRSDPLVNEVSARTYLATNQEPSSFNTRNNLFAQQDLSSPYGRPFASSSNQQPFDYTQTEPCVYSDQSADSTAYFHQSHRYNPQLHADSARSGSNLQQSKLAGLRQFAPTFTDRLSDLLPGRFDLRNNGFTNSSWLSEATASLRTTLTGTESSVGARGRMGGSRGPLAPTTSCPHPPVKSKSIDRAPKSAQDFLCKSWPPLQRKTFASVEEDWDEDFGLFDGLKKQSTQIEYEFNIPHRDIKFHERISQGVRQAIYRGHWHGEVWVHTYWNLTHSEIKRFWEEVARLSMIRHENVALFMGACMDPPSFAIVSTLRKYPTLHEKLHLMRDSLSQRTKVSIAKQIAQAVSYLHAKNFLVKRLHSRMVYLDPKVKLYLINLCLDDPDGHFVVRRRDLPYIAPEILRVVPVEPHIQYLRVPDTLFTAESDAYAFGTLLYEMFAEGYPFEKVEMDALVWSVGKGKREDTEQLNCSDVIRNLIQDCWAHDSLCRPQLFEINAQLSQPGVLKKRCSSDPERLNRLSLLMPY